MFKLAGTIIFVCLLAVICLAILGPMVVQDATTGNSGGALDNVNTSLDNINDAIEESPIGEFLTDLDEG